MGNIGRIVSHAVALSVAAASSASAFAQGVPLPVAPPGSVPTREELTPPVNAPRTSRPRVTVTSDIERSPCPLADPSYAGIRVQLKRVTLANLKGLSEAELTPLYRDLLGADRPVAVICEIRDVVATALRRAGYLAAVQIPTQEIADGEVRLELLYARLTAIRVRGDAGRSERLIASYLEPLMRDEVFNQRAAERYLLLAGDLPGYDVRLALKPTERAGEVYGEITLTRTPVFADLNVQNFAARETGRFGGQARLLLNDLTGLGDQTLLSVYSTADVREQQVVQLGHEFRVGGEGLTLSGRYSYAWTRPALPGAPDVLKARTGFGTGEVRYPFVRTEAFSLIGAGGLDIVNQSVRFAGVDIARDRVRTAFLRADLSALDTGRDPRWQVAGSVELRKGIGILNASPRPSAAGAVATTRIDGDSRAGLVRAQFNGELRLGHVLTGAVLARGQHAFDPVLSFEEYSAGNYSIGRGYDPGTLLGDSGLGIAGELRVARWTPAGPALVLQPFVFADHARVWEKGGPGTDRLTSVGGGVRASFANRYRLDLTLAIPTEHAGTAGLRGDPRLLLSFTTRLWPWGS